MLSPQQDTPLLPRISDYIYHYARLKPDTEALVLGERRVSYKQCAASVDRIAKALLASGVRKGDRVATLCTPHPDYFLIFLAACSVGAIWVGLNPRYRLDEYRHVLGDSEPRILLARTRIGERDFSKDLEELALEMPDVRGLVVLGGDPLFSGSQPFEAWLAAGDRIDEATLSAARTLVQTEDPALIVYTSGSTGRSKGALLPHRGLTRCSVVQLRYWDCHPLRLLNYLPINHIGCVGDLSCYCLVGGGTMIFLEQFDPLQALKIVQNEKVTWLGGVPTSFQMMLALPEARDMDFSSVQMAMWSGAAAPRNVIEAILEYFPLATSSYGLTETVGSITFAGPTRDIEELTDTIGMPVPEYEVAIMRKDGSLAQPGEEGEIVVRGDFIMSGYWRNAAATAEAIDEDDFFHTGDLAVELPDGRYRLRGRLKEMFVSGGYNVFPREIEAVLEKHRAVQMAAVVPAPDALFGEVGIAFVLVGDVVNEDELRTHCRDRLANYKIPKCFVLSRDLPMLPIGKIDKGALKTRARAVLKAD